ncbi:MAG: hypothetical protein DK304_000871 [Chloroflexi bacterium]|jgi:hypothetical protein|nr:MAG: hypothetical protein DK304_000871 [Chloroflexota bacterium]
MSDETVRKAEIEKRFSFLEARFSKQLNEDEMGEVLKGVESTVDISIAMRSFELTYKDEPRSIFHPYDKEEKS